MSKPIADSPDRRVGCWFVSGVCLDPGESEVGFVTTFVISATQVAQSFVKNTDVAICDIGVASLSTAYYEFFTPADGPNQPGQLINVTVASIDQDVRVRPCGGDDLENLTFSPNALVDQPMTPSALSNSPTLRLRRPQISRRSGGESF